MTIKYLCIALGMSYGSLYAQMYTLEDAIKTALVNNQKQKISAKERAIAKAKYQQSLAANYPSLDITLNANRRDEALVDEVKYNFEMPPSLAPFVGSSLPVDYTHTVMGRDTQSATAELQYALYTGGKISSLQNQARLGMEYAKEKTKLTEDEIVLNIKRYYGAYILSQHLEQLMSDTVARMETIYELTESFYKGDSLRVKKTDYLRTKMTLLNMKSVLASFESANELAKSALCFEMGIGLDDDIEVDPSSVTLIPLESSLEDYYEKVYIGNRLLHQNEIALQVKSQKMKEQESGYLPTLGLYANARTLHNSEHGGIINSTNNDSWNIGVALSYNLFSGGLTHYKVEAANFEKLKLQAQKAYLKSALTMKTKKAFLKAKAALKQVKIMQEALDAAKENSELNFRAYQEEMVETKDVLESQFMHSLTEAAYYKAHYNVVVQEAELNFLMGSSL